MANEREIINHLRAADDLNLLFPFQRESAAYHSSVNIAIGILSTLDLSEAGMTINEISTQVGLSYNTAAIYLRSLERLGKVSFHQLNCGDGPQQKKYFLSGREL